VQDDLDDLHGVVLDLLDLALGVVDGLPALVLPLPNHRVAVLEFILLEVVVEVAQQLLAVRHKLRVVFGLIDCR
jgi:hypothetical protein